VRESRFSEEQIIAILKESETGVETGELCRRHGITRGCFYRWKGESSQVITRPKTMRITRRALGAALGCAAGQYLRLLF